jgi:hypothetical protein
MSTFRKNNPPQKILMRLVKRYIWFALFSFLSLQAASQTHLIDSLENALKNSKNDSLAIIYITVLSNEYYAYDTAKSSIYIERANALAKKLKWDRAIALYYYHRGILKQLATQYDLAGLSYDSAIIYFDKEIARLKTKEEKDLIALEKSSALKRERRLT